MQPATNSHERSSPAVDPNGKAVELSGLAETRTALPIPRIQDDRLELLSQLWDQLRDLEGLVKWAGYVGLTAIIFAETGLLVGFFLPGDSLLVTAGLLAANPDFGLNVWVLGVILTIAAIVGDTVGYAFGKATGPRIFSRENSLFFHKDHLLRAQAFYEKHGGKTIIIARFMPIIRTFAPVVAGVGRMDYRRFLLYNVVGGAFWIWSMLMTGWILARTVPGVARHVEKIILVVVFLSILPGIIAWLRERRKKAVSA
jgi:membrane-associated protein